tara:strand:+ start:13 stop:252 length:240 start_codon:yes stop_codon:yes gene_type:complete
MKNKFNVGQEVYVGRNVQEKKEIIDIESFSDVTLYYMSDGTAYPESFLYIDGRVAVFRELWSLSDEERDRRVSNYFGWD